MPVTRVVLLFAMLAMTTSGCAFSTANLALSYEASAERKSPLSTIPPRTVLLTVDDQRPGAERDRVGDKKNGFGMVTAKVQSTKDVKSVVLDALRSELANNGHVVAGPTDRADVNITTTLKRYWSNLVIGFWDVEVTGIMAADVAVTPPGATAPAIVRPLTATQQEGFVIVTDGAYEAVLNKTLAEFVRNLARDPDFLTALKTVK